jgi:hypothetical protein
METIAYMELSATFMNVSDSEATLNALLAGNQVEPSQIERVREALLKLGEARIALADVCRDMTL